MEINRSDNPVQAAGLALSNLLFQYQEQPVLLLLSGGSALSLLEYVDTVTLLDHVTLGVVDERSSEDPGASNLLKLQATDFYHTGVKGGVGIIAPVINGGGSEKETALLWEGALRSWFLRYPNGVCLVTLGIGHDGHIAGMFPGDWGVDWNGEAWTVAYEVPENVNPYTNRLTLTNTFLIKQVNHAIVYAVGNDKEAVIKNLTTKTPELNNLPARVLYLMSSVQFFTKL